MIITSILELFGVSSAREYKTLLDARDRKIDVDVIHNMGFFQDPTNMIYKHCSEHHTAPSENLSVEPPSQQYASFPNGHG
ncbi:hypothetical protein Lal_00032172 [Lupinus albus]|nr:hypothetical protein Lal_00032172 [Lupinus albus]